MKISEMSTEQLAGVLVDLAEPVSEIVNDDATTDAFKRIVGEQNDLNQIGAFIREIIPLVFSTHFDSMCKIVATLTGKTPAEVKAQKGLQTINEAKAVFDEDLLDFFKSFVHTDKTK